MITKVRHEACFENSEGVYLTASEVDRAIRDGVILRRTSKARGHKEAHGFNGTVEQGDRNQCLGSLGQMIVAKALGVKYELGNLTFKRADLPGNVEVKSMGYDWYGLRVYDDTPDDRRVVGVVIPKGEERSQVYRIPGWFISREAKRPEWTELGDPTRKPFFAVPQNCLRPLSELREILRAEGVIQ